MKSLLNQALRKAISEQYYVLPRGPFIPQGSTPWYGDPNNIARLSSQQLADDLEEFIKEYLCNGTKSQE